MCQVVYQQLCISDTYTSTSLLTQKGFLKTAANVWLCMGKAVEYDDKKGPNPTNFSIDK